MVKRVKIKMLMTAKGHDVNDNGAHIHEVKIYEKGMIYEVGERLAKCFVSVDENNREPKAEYVKENAFSKANKVLSPSEQK